MLADIQSFREICRALGHYLLYFTVILCIPLGVAIGYEAFASSELHPQEHCTDAFLKTIGLSLLISFFLNFIGRKGSGILQKRESIFVAVSIWFLTAAIAALPFLFTGVLSHPIDAYFESMSGLTTTGSTIFVPKIYGPTGDEIGQMTQGGHHYFGTIQPIRHLDTGEIHLHGLESIGKALLFWRSFLQWLGGMGIVVLFIAVFPALGMGGKFLYETEIPGPNKEGLTPRIKETASILWKIYLGLTLLQVALLVLTNNKMPLFDAINLSLTTISTGGFTVTNNGLAAYESGNTLWVVAIFMILGSLNFTLYFHILKGKIYRIYEPEFFVFLSTIGAACLLMAYTLFSQSGCSFQNSLEYGSFEAISTLTSTGFSCFKTETWPFASQILMLILCYVGGMSGSTTGGIKIVRHAIIYRSVIHKIESIFRPDTVRFLTLGKKEIPEKTIKTVLIFFCLAISFTVLGTFILVLDGLDPQTALGIIASAQNNSGVSLNGVDHLAYLPLFSKCIVIFWMVLGRLEYFALLVLLVPAFWTKK